MIGETSAFACAVQGFENIDKGGKTPGCCDDSTMIALLSGVNRFSFSKKKIGFAVFLLPDQLISNFF